MIRLLTAIAMLAPSAHAKTPPLPVSTIASFCYLKDSGPGKDNPIPEVEPEARMPIASVSKVMTTWWLIATKGPDFRFPTVFHITPLDKDLYDVHIEGSRDPYYGRESLHFAISELNKLGIKNVRNLTFDENFKFFWAVTSKVVTLKHYFNNAPLPETVLSNLKSGSLTRDWKSTVAYAKRARVKLVNDPEFEPASISYLAKKDFQRTAETRSYVMRSAKASVLLKEMNRNSNNHAANQVFEHLGGPKAFKEFAEKKLGLNENDLRFINGSGDWGHVNGAKAYNEATCKATLKVLKDLRDELKKYKMDLQHVMSVIGRDANSNASYLYKNDMTNGATVAKTGSVNPNIALGGILSSKTGEYFFMVNSATSAGQWGAARSLVRSRLIELIRALGGAKAISYTVTGFTSFDAQSVFSITNEGRTP